MLERAAINLATGKEFLVENGKKDGVIDGWTEALLMMQEGSKWRLFIPPELAYSDKRSGSIEPNSTLIFDVELLEVKHAE